MAKWKIDTTHAFAEFSAQHIGISWVHGNMHGVTGEIDYDEDKPESMKFSGEVDTTTLNSHFAMRDNHLKGPDFLDVEKFPKLKFESTNVKVHGDHAHITGNLTIKDITKEIELEGTVNGIQEKPKEDGSFDTVIAFSMNTMIDRRDFGMDWNINLPGGGQMVGNEIYITLDVEAIKQ